MHRILEAFFRHPFRMLVLVIVLPAISTGVAFLLPRSYSSTATVWALRRYEIVGVSAVQNDYSAPAATQATALTELLATRSFAIAAAHETSLVDRLPASVRNDPGARDDALAGAIGRSVVVTAEGYNLYTVSATDQSPQAAQQIVKAVLDNFGKQSLGFSVLEGQNLLAAYQAQLTKAQQDAQAAALAETQYLAAHPGANATIDPELARLHAASTLAQGNVQSIQSQIAALETQIGLVGSGPDDLFKVIDQPVVPTRALSRTKQLLIGGVGGLVVALLICAIYIAISLRRDRSALRPVDLSRVTDAPVLMQIPHLSKRTLTISLLPSAGAVPYEESKRDRQNGKHDRRNGRR